MKQFAVLLICFVAVSQQQSYNVNQEYIARVQAVKDVCLQESSANPPLVDRLLQAGEFFDDGALKCFQKCVFVRLNVMNAAGEIETDLVRAQLPISDQIEVVGAMQSCRNLKGPDSCETAFAVAKCLSQL